MPRLRSASVATMLFLLGSFCLQSLAMNRAAGAEPTGVFTESKLAHMVFFTLKESNDANRGKLVDAAKEYLGGHPGEIYFSVGRMVDLKEPVSVTDFDVALHVVFQGKQAHDKYLVSERHLKFVAVAKELCKKVRGFDSGLEQLPPRQTESK
jgi:hypothetical protein